MVKMLYLLPMSFLLQLNCSNPDHPKNTSSIPTSFDTLYDDYNGTRVLKVRKIFRKGISYRYSAQYIDTQGNTISDNFVEIQPSGERWSMQPELQDVVNLKFGYTEEEKATVLANPVNKTYDLAGRWTDETMEGVIENEREIWMHPIRHNQYIFTEVAPFPEVKLPLEVGKTWEGGIGGLGGWGDWDDTTIRSNYTVKEKKTIQLPIGAVECWVIEATSTFELGESKATFHFSEDFGFVKMDYTNYVGQRLVFEMVEIRMI